MTFRLSILSLGMLAVFSGPVLAQEAAEPTHVEMFNAAGENVGMVTIKPGPEGLLLSINMEGLVPGPHGFHVHHTGNCSDHDHFKGAGGHVKTDDGDQHGLLNPQGPEVGDLPNLIVHQDGSVKAEIYAPDLKMSGDGKDNIMDTDGSAFMVHEQADDHKTQPIGGAGERIACGVIKEAE
ncbi:MAG: superoxide dismutase family protein [Alphaproteobacteria bacterium]|nr:superoxide dismutase family protein [Alphaproteobacteria bacterium]MCD8520439.1 superoxide dismutase family protein [Alphaproteobacteria bacterium]MCD8526282.1 superoxide dismutase family protein [Alphaproteobacteria bacterium]MCD8571126.1 superoxide dismutase family protein [Alphaproteobacteria bacterium]